MPSLAVVLFIALHTVHIVLITMGCGVRDRVRVICNASAWCPALYPCQVLYINIHLAPILLFPSCHLTEKAVRDTYRAVHYSAVRLEQIIIFIVDSLFLTDHFLLSFEKCPS